jgi:hypothetical protein
MNTRPCSCQADRDAIEDRLPQDPDPDHTEEPVLAHHEELVAS